MQQANLGLEDSLSVDNVVWCNSVLASSGMSCIYMGLSVSFIMLLPHTRTHAGSILGIVIYTGKDTRSVLNTSDPRTKVYML